MSATTETPLASVESYLARLAALIGARLQEVGKSQRWLSRESGVPRTTLGRRMDDGNFYFGQLALIAVALDVPILSLLAHAEGNPAAAAA